MTPEQQLLHLIDRAERCALLPDEADRLRQGIQALQARDHEAARLQVQRDEAYHVIRKMVELPAPAEATWTDTTYVLETQQPDGSWEPSSMRVSNLDFARERLARRRDRKPDHQTRIGYRVSLALYGVMPEPSPAAPEVTP